MTKVLKNILISLLGAFMFMFAGIFFVGCGSVDYSKIKIVSNVEGSVVLGVGESVTITFTIEGYQSGFNNQVSLSGQDEVFTYSEPNYSSSDSSQFTVTVTGVAGGTGTLLVTSVEGQKQCEVDISVEQSTTSISSNNEILYVTNGTDFVPNYSMFTFDPNTTDRDLSYYFVVLSEISDTDYASFFLKYNLVGIDAENGIGYFNDDSSSDPIERPIYQFESVTLDENGNLFLIYDGQSTSIDLQSEFEFMAVYDSSVGSENILFAHATVYVLPSLSATVTGGYLQTDGTVEFESVLDEIVIVPESSYLSKYLIRVEMNNIDSDFDIIFTPTISNDNVSITRYYYNDDDSDTNILYFLISQNVIVSSSTDFSLNIYYSVAQDIADENVNFNVDFSISTQIAPTKITINETLVQNEMALTLYHNALEGYGWEEIRVDILSDCGTEPNYDGIYLVFDENLVEVLYNNVNISSGEIIDDISVSIYVRGKGSQATETSIRVYVSSSITNSTDWAQEWDEEREDGYIEIPCSIISAPTTILVDATYNIGELYVSYTGGTVSFDEQLYTEAMFKSATITFSSGTDVVNISTNSSTPYVYADGRYYLNLTVTPKAVGMGRYIVTLDTGATLVITFQSVQVLESESISVALTNEDNDNVRAYSLSRTSGSEFDNVINLEIQNTYSNGSISYGSTASFVISGNYTSLISSGVSGVVRVLQSDSTFRLTTITDGDTYFLIEISGYSIHDFGYTMVSYFVYVYVSSYSLVNEYSLRSEGETVLSTTLYYGTDTYSSVQYSAYVDNTDAKNFLQLTFTTSGLREIFGSNDETFLITKAKEYDNYYTQELVYQTYDSKYVYFYVLDSEGNALTRTTTTVSFYINNVLQKTVTLSFDNGLMFYSDVMSFEYQIEDQTYTVTAQFSNVFSLVGGYGTFDVTTFTYTNTYSSAYTFVLRSLLSQRNLTKRYDVRISVSRFQSVENISLLSSETEINFTNETLTASFIVTLYPTTATNINVAPRVDFISSNGNPYSNMVTSTVTSLGNGQFLITLSCESFYQANMSDITNIDDDTPLSGTIYIYPSEWGDSISSIDSGLSPIILSVRYRNGSAANPYLLESAEDVLAINSNETTLQSHYEISSVIDMSSVTSATPIGIIVNGSQYSIVGFSGSIVGSTSQAAITNINITDSNFTSSGYSGLFAIINEGASIENVSITGTINFSNAIASGAYIGLLTAINYGTLENVGVTINSSSSEYNLSVSSGGQLYFGGLVGINIGSIIQDFSLFESSGLTSKNLAYFNDYLNISVSGSALIYVGGVAGASLGVIERISPSSSYKLYGYTGYSAYTLINVVGSTSGTINVGGIVGYATYNLFNSGITSGNTLSNLLVGGEISTMGVSLSSSGSDRVGGIAGLVDTLNSSTINIEDNTSRVFLRGNAYVGGIVGYDTYPSAQGGYDQQNLTTFGEGNIIQAVDDARGAFYSASIIRTSLISSTVETESRDESFYQFYYAIGNYKTSENERTYTDTSFSAYSYLTRDPINYSEGGSLDFTSTDKYYGDYLVVDAEDFEIVYAYFFDEDEDYAGVVVGNSGFSLTGEDSSIYAYLLFYFQVTDDLSGSLGSAAQENIVGLNYFTPNSQFYPFVLDSQDVSISASTSSILSIDSNGNMTVSGTGYAEISLSSILNVNDSQKIYIYVVNYFDNTVQTSIFYDSPSHSGSNITGGKRIIYGNSSSSVYVVPTYTLSGGQDSDGVSFTITEAGILQYKGVSYFLAKNTQITANVENVSYLQYSTDYFVKYADLTDEGGIRYINSVEVTEGESGYAVDEDGNYYVYVGGEYIKVDIDGYKLDENGNKVLINFSSVQVSKQTISFYKTSSSTNAGDTDIYTLVPVLQVVINGQTFTYVLSGSAITLTLEYQETATEINSKHTTNSLQTNTSFEETISITSSNQQDYLFYYITGPSREYIQSRMPSVVGIYYDNFGEQTDYETYMNSYSSADLFIIKITRQEGTNVFDLKCSINTDSTLYKNRFSENIYGEYIFTFYASELEDGVECYFRVFLDEATLEYVSVNNYSNINDASQTDEVIVPSQRGLLEIILDPTEASFNSLTISNNSINSLDGAGIATFTFVYSTESDYVLATNVGTYSDGALTLTYEEIISFYEYLNEQNSEISYSYNGRIYVAYYLASNGVDDNVDIKFDVTIDYGSNGDVYQTSLALVTKLTNYISVEFEGKDLINNKYYVARGLSYNLTLNSFGFTTEQLNNITYEISDDSLVSLQSNGVSGYVLTITSDRITYSSSEEGREVTIHFTAEKTVDDETVTCEYTLTFYIMEYVLNYQYVEGVFEDVVYGMSDGVISVAIGNPYTLQFDITDFMEYNSSDSEIVAEVNTFLDSMTQNITWKVYEGGQEYTLEQNRSISSDYYQISSFTVTPIQLYDPTSEIYYFSAEAYYTMSGGIYSYTELLNNRIYTEFSFSVHNQSTQESPIPIRTYEEFIAMEEDSWYILLDDITLPNSTETEQFTPISTAIAGLDGNGYSIYFSGTYNFDTASVGVFSTVSSDTILQNVTVELLSNTTFNMSVSTFEVGLLAAINNGIITNCEVGSIGTASLSVLYSISVSSSYVAGLVAENNGYITNSRSTVSTIYTQVNIAGFVAENYGHIASSYFRGGSLVSVTQGTANIAGFVLTNSGEIYTSYVSGESSNNANSMYYTGTDNGIRSSSAIAGFVFSNSGAVYDCYSNILLTNTGYNASGFVDENTGRIERCFSISVLGDDDSSNYGFVRINDIDDEEDGIVDCYYLSDSELMVNQNVTNNYSEVEVLTEEDFANIDEYFSNYVVADGRDINSVWFFNDNASDTSNFNGKEFNIGRIELVSANVVAYSRRVYDHAETVTVTDTSTGTSVTYVEYVYTYASDGYALGSTYNPILISSAEEFETYIAQECNSAGYNYSYYRFISDIDYSDYLYNSSLYTTKFVGYLEGNFMTLSNITLISSSSSLTYAGLFAEIGNSSNVSAIGTVMNFTYIPAEVNFASANVVGALAGRLNGGTIYNIYIEDGEGNTITGNNIVGGVVGLTTGEFSIKNVYSTYNTIARNSLVSQSNDFITGTTSYSNYSFAGVIVGVLSGTGTIYNTKIDTVVSSIADKAGLMFGLIDTNATVYNAELEVQSDMLLNGYSYAGLVAGESRGTVINVSITGSGTFTNFRTSPYVATAVGGFAGLVSGGTLTNIKMEENISISTESTESAIENLGGIAGMITASVTMENIEVNADITGFSAVGGVVGYINNQSGGYVTFRNVSVEGTFSAIGIKQTVVAVGGLAGRVATSTQIYLTSTYVEEAYNTNTFDIDVLAGTYNYGTTTSIGVGGLIGLNESTYSHIVEYAIVSLTGEAYMYDLSYSNASETTETISTNGGVLTSTSLREGEIIGIVTNNYSATGSTYDCNLSYSFTYVEGENDISTAVCQILVNFFGAIATA